MEKILDFQTREIPGEHARGNFRLLLSENETGINGLNAPIQLCGHGNTAGALFCGYQEKVEIKEEGRYRIADVQAVSGTILLDQKKCNRVFQKKAQTYMGIANTVTADTEHSACILPGSDMQTGGTLIQYQETDWNFLKRMASQLGLPLVPDISYYYPRFYLGLPEGEKKELGEILSCDMCFDGRYYAVSGRCTVDRKDFICYDVVTGTRLSLGDRVTYEGRELTVSRKKTELVRGEVIFTYRLAGSSYTWVPWEDNLDYTGMSFVGAIVGTQGEQVEVAFDIDQTAAGGNRYGFAPATGNLMYCMPQKGTKTSLYIGNGNEAQGIATGCIRTNGSTCEGTTIESNGGLVLMAKEGIRLESMTGIAMQGISASKYTGYPPYDDAPKEGEFDWEGFTRNLAIGLGVVAVCAIGAAISIATLGAGSILAGAFIGAGIGALSTTAMKAGEEISTGNVRSAKEAFRDVGISAASGFITGAFGAKFPGAHRLVEGVVDTAVSAGERLAYAVFDDSMSWDEKWAYAFDPGQMVADFVTGVVIGEILDGIMAAIQNKLRSIFANYDAAMREAFESGNYSSLRELMLPEEVARYGEHWLDVAEKISNEALDNQIDFIKNGGITKPGGGAYKPAKISAAVDLNTGDIYFGYNGANKFNPSIQEIHPDLQQRINRTMSLAGNSIDNEYASRMSFEKWSVDNCAEIYSVNNALQNQATLDNIFINTKYFKDGKYALPCRNCQVTFEGCLFPKQ